MVFDTLAEHHPQAVIGAHPWCKSNNPMTVVRAFPAENSDFDTDAARHGKLHVAVTRDGYFKRTG